jgi:hypothetical protein
VGEEGEKGVDGGGEVKKDSVVETLRERDLRRSLVGLELTMGGVPDG